MTVPEKDFQNNDGAYKYYEDFMQKQQPTDVKTGAFYHIVSTLSIVARINYGTLRRAYGPDDQVVLAWSCRNLLELAVFTKYVLISAENAKEFADARLVDNLEIGTALRNYEMFHDPSLTVSTFDRLIDETKKQMQQEGVTRTRFLGTGELARKVGMKETFESLNKLCSKFVHPTSWSILAAADGPARFPDARDFLFYSGAEYFNMVHAEIIPHIKLHGLRHA